MRHLPYSKQENCTLKKENTLLYHGSYSCSSTLYDLFNGKEVRLTSTPWVDLTNNLNLDPVLYKTEDGLIGVRIESLKIDCVPDWLLPNDRKSRCNIFKKAFKMNLNQYKFLNLVVLRYGKNKVSEKDVVFYITGGKDYEF